jgi:hypothetical protein
MELTVVATALDAAEATLGQTEQAVLVAPLDRVAAVPSPRPRLGEDGVLGSRGVDLTALDAGALEADVVVSRRAPPPGWLARQAYR